MAKNTLPTLLCVVLIIWVMKSGISCFASPHNFNMKSSKNNTIEDDKLSLLALKDRIISDTVLAKNWTQEAPHCTWMGVTCSLRHPLRVTALDLSNMSLQGTLPQEIGNLSFLSYLNIIFNNFTGPIPATIGNLGRLRTLIMARNQLSGEIPYTIGRLRKLEILSLYVNKLEGTIPTSIFNISGLKEIGLGANHLTGTLPDLDICHHLPNLQILGLQQNRLNGNVVWSSLLACSKLEELYLFTNNFTGTIPMYIGNFSQLQRLLLHKNQLTGIIPTTIGNLSKLEAFRIDDNNIHGIIPSEMGQLSNLFALTLAVNSLNGEIPASIYNLTKLQALSLPVNKISGQLPSSLGIRLPVLEFLEIGENRFTGLIPSSIANLSQLNALDLGSNSFTGCIPVNLGNLSNLQILLLEENQFSNNLSIPEQDFLTSLAKCKYLAWIDFSNNPSITGEIPRSFFSSISQSATLTKFLASYCGISGKLPTKMSNLTSLIWLGFGNNKLEGTIPETFGALIKLQRLELEGNMLQGTIPDNICNLTNLYYIRLSSNNLSGQLPLCFGSDLPLLKEIYLSENSFNSNIPSTLWINYGIQKLYLGYNFFDGTLSQEIGNLKSLTELNLSGNQLSGNIPHSIGNLQSLVALSMENNKLNGSIPDSLSTLKGLEHLDVSHNDLSGEIPHSLVDLTFLEYLNVSFNQLSGEIPNEGPFKNFTAECFIGNKNLCGVTRFKVEPCKFVKLKPSHKNKHISRYIMPLMLAFSIFLAIAIIFFIIRYRRRKSSNDSGFPIGLLLERVSYYDILRATKNFDEANLIGRGSFGSVYKGQISDTFVAAVKVFNLETLEALKSFDVECQILRSVRHRNLVKVITSCSNLDFKALVMEYMPNGNLERWIHSTESSLSISQRFAIMIDVAAALEYLHHGCSTPIIHCDLKPNNILLDNHMVAHVADFGIAKLLTGEEIMQQTKTLGTIGYMAPEYGSSGLVSTATDVYSYGIILMEIFTKRKPTDGMFSEELTMKKWVSEAFSNSLTEILDFELLKTKEEGARIRYERCLMSVIELAVECTSEVSEERPSMTEVVEKIKKMNPGHMI